MITLNRNMVGIFAIGFEKVNSRIDDDYQILDLTTKYWMVGKR
jgi:hypothetical protein